MKFGDATKSRMKGLRILTFALIIILALKLAVMTLAEGKKYREIANNKRVREVDITAPRGEIRDRNGVLLAGNKPVFTLQLLKDELTKQDRAEMNPGLVQLLRLLERDGVNYEDQLPIVLNVIRYKTPADYVEYGHSALDEVAERLIDHQLVGTLLSTYYVDPKAPTAYQFLTINRAMNALHVRGIDVPIVAAWSPDGLQVYFDGQKDSRAWKLAMGIDEELGAVESMVALIGQDKTLITKVLNHSIARGLAFDVLKNAGLDKGLEMEAIANAYEESYRDKKMAGMKHYPGITMDSSAKNDFLQIFRQTALKSFLEGPLPIDDNGLIVDLPRFYIDAFERKGGQNLVTYEISLETQKVDYQYVEGEAIEDVEPLDYLVRQAENLEVLEELLSNDGMKGYMQRTLIDKGVYTDISIAEDFAYVQEENNRLFKKRYDLDEESDPSEDLEVLINRYELDDAYNLYEKRGVINLLYAADQQVAHAYIPFNFAYGLKDMTVAAIAEQLSYIKGIKVAVEPIRYYPYGTMASHVLGYLGKISQPQEVEKYNKDPRYGINDMIGKTGLEESFEDHLKGIKGHRKVVVDAKENTIEVLYENLPKAGGILYTTIDADLQRVTETGLAKTLENLRAGGVYTSPWGNYQFSNHKDGRPYYHAQSGAAVMVDIKTGEVLALASYPGYDPNLFATGITATDWASLLPEYENDPLAPRPLYNIATQTAVQSGSIFKMIIGLAALEKGFSPEATIEDMGYVRFRDTQFNCLAWESSRATHGAVDIYRALQDSCNYYFYSLVLGENQRLGVDIGVKVDIEDIVELCKKFGLDHPTGIEIRVPQETPGGIPEPDKKLRRTQETMRAALEERITNYYTDEVGDDPVQIANIVDEIVSWTEMDEALSRKEVTDRLHDLGINGEKRPEGLRMNMTDYIKYSYLNHAAWHMGDTLNVSIGQGQNEYSLMQMTNYVATIANGGYRHQLTLVHDLQTEDHRPVKAENQRGAERIGLVDYGHLDDIKQGMLQVSRYGTGAKVFADFPVKVGSKTGTAEREGINPGTGMNYDDFSWMVAFAPYEDPEIAIGVLLVQGGPGGHGGPLIRDMIAAYMGLDNQPEEDRLPIEVGGER